MANTEQKPGGGNKLEAYDKTTGKYVKVGEYTSDKNTRTDDNTFFDQKFTMPLFMHFFDEWTKTILDFYDDSENVKIVEHYEGDEEMEGWGVDYVVCVQNDDKTINDEYLIDFKLCKDSLGAQKEVFDRKHISFHLFRDANATDEKAKYGQFLNPKHITTDYLFLSADTGALKEDDIMRILKENDNSVARVNNIAFTKVNAAMLKNAIFDKIASQEQLEEMAKRQQNYLKNRDELERDSDWKVQYTGRDDKPTVVFKNIAVNGLSVRVSTTIDEDGRCSTQLIFPYFILANPNFLPKEAFVKLKYR